MFLNRTAIILGLAAISAASLVLGCKGVEIPDQVGNDVVTMICEIAEQDGSRVSISEQGKTRWEPGDEILVHGRYTQEGKYAVVTLTSSDISADGKKATISFTGVEPYDRTDKGYTSSYYAGYPASSMALGEQCYYYTDFISTTEPLMAAYDDGGKFVFYNICGLMGFTVSGSFDEVELKGNADETVGYEYLRSYLVQKDSGSPRLDFSYSNSSDGGTSGPLTSVSCPVTADGSTFNIIGIPLGVDFTEGFTLSFKKGGKIVKVAKSSAPANIGRGRLLRLGDVTSHLQDPSEEETHESGIDTASAINLGEDETANCYIVEDPGTYKFKAVQGNSTKSVGTVASVEVLWETYGTATAPAKGSIIEAVDFEGSWIYFRTPDDFHAGNALIAAKNSAGKILWSWHIWVPESMIDEDTYGLADHAFMDRNLGALMPTVPSGKVNPASYGLLYQWGRKDPFPAAKEYKSSSPAAVAGIAKTVHTGPLSLAESIANPTVFANPNAEKTDWCSDSDADYWGDKSGAKSIYDPCPAGYKVSKRDEVPAFFNSDLTAAAGFEYDSENGWFTVGEPIATFPLAGYIETTGSHAHAYDRALVWNSRSDSSNPYAGYHQYLYNDSGTLKSRVYSSNKARAGSIRCMNETEIPFSNEPGMPVQGSYTRVVFDSSIQELSGICFSKDKDFIWGVGDEGDIFKIYLDWSKSAITLKSISIYKSTGSDLEDVTLDPNTGDLYFAKEADRVDVMRAPNYSSKSYAFYVTDAADFGNSGLEGIAWYTKDNTLYVGSQTGATLWKYKPDGTLIWKRTLGSIAPKIQEVGGLCYDAKNDWLWVTDSEACKLFVFDGEVTRLLAMYDVSSIGNAESVMVVPEYNCVLVGDDGSTSKIYKYSFTGL